MGSKCAEPGADPLPTRRARAQVQEGRDSGGHDWTPLVGSTLCETCYKYFNKHGTLKRSASASAPAAPKEPAASFVAKVVAAVPAALGGLGLHLPAVATVLALPINKGASEVPRAETGAKRGPGLELVGPDGKRPREEDAGVVIKSSFSGTDAQQSASQDVLLAALCGSAGDLR